MLNRLEMMRIFCITAEASSFKEAASKLGVSPQAVTRAIKELENTLGEPLFYRNTRQMRITDFGSDLALRARDRINNIDQLFQRHDQQPENDMSGIVRITAPTIIGRHFLIPILARIAIRYPNINLDLRLADSITDVIEQQIDIGVRVGFLRDSGFVARAATKIGFYSVGSPELVARTGKPNNVQELLDMPTIGLVDKTSGKRWPWYNADGHQFMPRTTAFLTDDPETEFQMVVNGVGYGQIADCIALPYIQSGKLVCILEDQRPPPWDLYVYRPQRGPVPARIRMVYDEMITAFIEFSQIIKNNGQ